MGVVKYMTLSQSLLLLFSLQTPLSHPLPHPRKKAQRTNSVVIDCITNSICICIYLILHCLLSPNSVVFALLVGDNDRVVGEGVFG